MDDGGAGTARSEDRPDFKALYRNLDITLGRIEKIEKPSEMLSGILDILANEFRDELGFESGRLYERVGAEYILCCTQGDSRGARIGYRVPPDYPPHRRTLEQGILIMGPGDPGFDREIEAIVGVDSTFAAIAVGEGNTHVFAFSVRGEIREEEILYSLSAVRHVINLKLRQRHLAGALEEARLIQESLLPASPPRFPGFDIAGRSVPADAVGGDLFDWLPLSEGRLGLAIADASGHGLQAALLARDVITGLRMGGCEELAVAATVERLNKVVSRAALSSRFISLFYAGLSADGTLEYCNAGQTPPLLLHDGGFDELSDGGLLLGPNPEARYGTGLARIRPGGTLILYSDGVTECENERGEPFGTDGLRRAILSSPSEGARGLVDALFSAVSAHAAGRPAQDDVTIVVVKRQPLAP